MTSRACIDCGRPAPATRCRECERRHQKRRDHEGEPWRVIRARVLAEEPWCRTCQMVRSAEVDHIRAVETFAPDQRHRASERHNLQGICKPCHLAKTNREKRKTLRQGGSRR